MEKFQYKLSVFEGPLDLLLTLIQKNKVSIYDIPIVEITDQYMEVIENADDSGLDDAGDFIVMASQLLYIKSKMLLPKNEEEEEEEDPREELARRLLEYKEYKEASEKLRKSEFATKNMIFRETEKIDFPLPVYDRKHQISELLDAFENIMARKIRKMAPEKTAFVGIVGHEKVSVDDMVQKICDRLSAEKSFSFKTLFAGDISKPEMIATFLAVLEMIKLSKIVAEYNDMRDDFIISPAAV